MCPLNDNCSCHEDDEDDSEPLTHFFHCWRFPDHHRCAVALIERQAKENDHLLVRAATAERELRQSRASL